MVLCSLPGPTWAVDMPLSICHLLCAVATPYHFFPCHRPSLTSVFYCDSHRCCEKLTPKLPSNGRVVQRQCQHCRPLCQLFTLISASLNVFLWSKIFFVILKSGFALYRSEGIQGVLANAGQNFLAKTTNCTRKKGDLWEWTFSPVQGLDVDFHSTSLNAFLWSEMLFLALKSRFALYTCQSIIIQGVLANGGPNFPAKTTNGTEKRLVLHCSSR